MRLESHEKNHGRMVAQLERHSCRGLSAIRTGPVGDIAHLFGPRVPAPRAGSADRHPQVGDDIRKSRCPVRYPGRSFSGPVADEPKRGTA